MDTPSKKSDSEYSTFLFWQFDHMGLGSIWQELSYILTHQNSPLVIHAHLNDYYFNRLKTIVEDCLAPPRHPIQIIKKEVTHYSNAYERNNTDWFRTSGEICKELASIFKVEENQISTYNCDKRHSYWPLRKMDRPLFAPKEAFICVDFIFRDYFGKKPTSHYEHKNLSPDHAHEILDYIQRKKIPYVDLSSGNLSIAESAQLMSHSTCLIGREGGWSHVAHSAQIPFYPLMHPSDRVFRGLNKAHGKENIYLKPFSSALEYKSLIENEICHLIKAKDLV